MKHLTAPLLLALAALPLHAEPPAEPAARLVVSGEVLHPVDDRLFGQFLEIASWGEPGPDTLADPETGDLPPEVVDALRELHAPIVRFPGGIDVDRVDWTDRIDLPAAGDPDAPAGVPTRPAGEGRPTLLDSGYPNRFGYDEFLRLTAELDAEALIVLNFLETLYGDVPLEEGARHAAGLVAYLNAEVGAELPEGMPDWPALRAANGHPEPHGVPVFQVGNETWNTGRERIGPAAEAAGVSPQEHVTRCLAAFGEAIHAVDPSVELICDSQVFMDFWGEPVDKPVEEAFMFGVLSDPRVQEHYAHTTIHAYQPWGSDTVTVDGEEADAAAMSPEAAYLACVGIPNESAGSDPPVAVIRPREQRLAAATGRRVAFTEWNWNGWGKGIPGGQNPGTRVYAASRAGGAGSYLNAMLRAGERSGGASIGTQSMMLANNWFIGAVRVQEMPERSGPVPVVTPTGRATGLYAEHHGDRRLATTWERQPAEVVQDVVIGGTPVMSPMPRLDVVVTADGGHYYVHAVHRRWSEPGVLELALPTDAAATGVRHEVVAVDAGDGVYTAERREAAVADAARLVLPPASVSVTVIPRGGG